MTRADTSLIGTMLDHRYRVERLLARGGMSSVYRGMDTRLDRPVAIKIMDPRLADDHTFVQRFEREARSAAKLHHPHVVAVHDQGIDRTDGSDSDRAFLIMELVAGGTLRDLLHRRGPLDLALALSIAEPILAALAAAHEAGLVHRDVKPENVLIGPGGPGGAGLVKVADFGLVRAVAGTSTTSSSSVILGTVSYLSPERISTGSTGPAGDVYSTGILLYEMLTGQVPYRADDALSVVYRHVNEDVPAPSAATPGVAGALDQLVHTATRRDPHQRFANAGALLAQLHQVRAQLGISPVAVPVPPAANTSPQTDLDGVGASNDADVVDKTVPHLPVVTSTTEPVTGPRGTRALNHSASANQQHSPSQPPSQPTEQDPKPERRKRRRGPVLALLAALIVLLGGGIGAGVWWFTGGRWVAVPQVVGMDQSAAERTLRDAQLAPTFTQQRHNTAPSGTVISTDPATDTDLLSGDKVAVLISTGKPTVPDVAAGTSQQQAESAIREAQLTPKRDPSADAFDATVAKGTVLRLAPSTGTPVNIDGDVRIALSKGPPPVPVPGVSAMSKDAAFDKLREAGFQPYEAGEEFSADLDSGKVTRTDPESGSSVDGSSDKRIGVYVSNAVEVPMVLGQQTQQAESALTEAGLRPETQGKRQKKRKPRISLVIGQDPTPGQRVEKGSTITLDTIP